MARDDFSLAPLVVEKWKERFEAFDYALILNGPFEITNLLDTLQKEAGVKGCAVIIKVSLVPGEDYFPPPPEEKGEISDEQQTG